MPQRSLSPRPIEQRIAALDWNRIESDLGPAAAMSLIYFLIILLLSWIFYTVITRGENAR